MGVRVGYPCGPSLGLLMTLAHGPGFLIGHLPKTMPCRFLLPMTNLWPTIILARHRLLEYVLRPQWSPMPSALPCSKVKFRQSYRGNKSIFTCKVFQVTPHFKGGGLPQITKVKVNSFMAEKHFARWLSSINKALPICVGISLVKVNGKIVWIRELLTYRTQGFIYLVVVVGILPGRVFLPF